MRIDIISLFPNYFESPFHESILKRAQAKNLLELSCIDLRNFGEGPHKKVDDRTFGGGPGMVLMAPPLKRAIDTVRKEESYVIHLSPQGKPLTQAKCDLLSQKSHLILLAGHYEGIDERIIESEVDEEISIGDYVLTNGALAAIVLVDAVTRLIPGVLGDDRSAKEDSFKSGLLDHPHFTHPVLYNNIEAPSVLRSGNHAAIKEWRALKSRERTILKRPDLYSSYLGSQSLDTEKITVVISTEDLEREVKFYKENFKLTLLAQTETHAYFKEGITLAKGDKKAYPILFIYSLREKTAFDEILRLLIFKRRLQGPLREIKGGCEASFIDEGGRAWLLRYLEDENHESE